MRLAVVQHLTRPAPAQDLEALAIDTARAVERDADVVMLPAVPALYQGPLGEELYCRIEQLAPDAEAIVAQPSNPGEIGFTLRDVAGLGRCALLWGDACIDPEVLAAAGAAAPGLALLAPASESDLQAQAALELAIGLSTSLASVVVVVEPDGADIGEPGHGGSAIVHLGQVLAEAMTGDDLLIADVPAPLGPPEAAGPLPEIPPVLLQRIAAHRGQRLAVDYPADLG